MRIAWNRGLTKKIDNRLNYERPTQFKKGNKPRGGFNTRFIKNHKYLPGRSRLPILTIEQRKEKKRLNRKKWKYSLRKAGKLLIQTIQLIYEDNIKQYGTLTCYLCLKPIEFGKDHLEHKIPLSRGGNNEYANLAIACQKCNCKKHNKTVEEFKKEVF